MLERVTFLPLCEVLFLILIFLASLHNHFIFETVSMWGP